MGLIHLLMCVGLMRVVIGAALSDPKAVEHTRNEILQRIRRQTEGTIFVHSLSHNTHARMSIQNLWTR